MKPNSEVTEPTLDLQACKPDDSTLPKKGSVTQGSPRSPAGKLPERVGKYRIVDYLGRGGQGTVYRAVHPVLGRDVVVKLAARGLPPDSQQRLVEEGRTLARLEDAGIAHVYDVDVHEGRPFVVSEYVSGRPLSEVVRRARPTPRAAARIVAEVARVVDYAHRQGVVHRDLKPANILIDAAGRPRVLDFGLALVAQQVWGADLTPDSSQSGTLSYMAPEQANGESAAIGPRTDVFGLGAILYELLTGRPPYSTGAPDAIEAIRRGTITPPIEINPAVPLALDGLCRRALAADPEQRIASAELLRKELLAYVRRPWLALGLAAAAVLLCVAAGAWYISRKPDPVASVPPTTPPIVEEEPGPGDKAPDIQEGPDVRTTASSPANSPEPQPVAPAAAELRPEPPPGWQVYHSTAGAYSIWFPGQPTENTSRVETKRGEREMIQAQLKDAASGLTFIVSYAEFNDRVFPDSEQALDAARDGALAKSKAELLSEESIQLGVHPGREIRFGVPKLEGIVLRCRFYLVGQLNYQLLAVGPEQAVEGPAAQAFFDSFRLDREF